MRELLNKYGSSFYKIALSFFLFFFSFSIHAQSEIDTIYKVDAIDTASHEESNIVKTNYFLKRSDIKNNLNDSLQLRHVPADVVKKMKADDDFWYANAPVKGRKIQQGNDREPDSIFQKEWFQVLLWLVIIAGFTGFIIFYLSNNNGGLFRKRIRRIDSVTEGELETDNIFEISYQREISKAIEKGNYRLAVRLMFLKMLRDLSNKNIIQYKQDRTNFDYLLQLHSSAYYNDFFKLARNYEYSWYGQFDIRKETFDVINSDFKNFEQKIGAV